MVKNNAYELDLKRGGENESECSSGNGGFNSESDLCQREASSCEHAFSNEVFQDDTEVKTHVEDLSNENQTENNSNGVQSPNSEEGVNTEPNTEQITSPQNAEDLMSTNADNICGAWCFKPKWLQKFATPNWFLVLYCKLGIIQEISFSYFIYCLNTLERRYDFSRKISDNIFICSSILPIFLGIFIGYFGGMAHRTKILAYAMLLQALCCFLMAVPYAIYGPVQDIDQERWQRPYFFSEQICSTKEKSEKWCFHDGDRQPAIGAILIFFFAIITISLTKVVYYAAGLSYMDDNSRKRNIPFYISIVLANLMFGPQIGEAMSSYFLTFNEDPSVDPGYDPEDRRWIGAWWLGFLVQGFSLLIYIIPLTWLPPQLPNQAQLSRSYYMGNQTWTEMFKGLASALNRLARNKIYLCVFFYLAISLVGHNSYYITLPTYVRHQFQENSLTSGFSSIWVSQVILVILGYLVWKFRPSIKRLTIGLVLSEIMISICFLVLMSSKCPKVGLFNYGVLPDGTLNIQNECNKDCQCLAGYFAPICDLDGETMYFSSCYAGCHKFDYKTQVYSDCSCIKQNTGTFDAQQSISRNYCKGKECKDQALPHIFSLPAIQVLSNVAHLISIIILLRSVYAKDKAVAIGALLAVESFFGFFPDLIVVELIMKYACLLWDRSCDQTGRCIYYDTDSFSYILHGMSAAFSLISVVFLIAIYCMRFRISDLYKIDARDNEEEQRTDEEHNNLGLFTKVLSFL